MVALSSLITSSLLFAKWGPASHLPILPRRFTLQQQSPSFTSDRRLQSSTKLSCFQQPTQTDNVQMSDMWWKGAALGALVLQNTGLAVAMRLSRIGKAPGQNYISSTAVVLSETIKVLIVVILRLIERRNTKDQNQKRLLTEIRDMYTPAFDIGIIMFSSALYVLQNNLQYIATSSLPAAVYQVSVQMKTLTAALVSYWAFGRSLTPLQWLSILLLTIGTIMVQLSAQSAKAVNNVNLQVGLIAVGLSCLTSAIAGVAQEQILKNGKLSLWARNTQVCTVSLLLAIFAAMKDREAISSLGFFHGYSPLVWTVILLQAVGGLLVSIVVKQTDSVVKGFASSGAILFSCFFSLWILRDIQGSMGLLVGALLVSLSTVGYGRKTLWKGKQQAELLSASKKSD